MDTSTDVAGVAIGDSEALLIGNSVLASGQQAETLAPLIAVSMRQAAVEFAQLGAVVCAAGPGPYTGLRVGVMTAQIIAEVARVSAFGVGTHDLLAQQLYEGEESIDLVVLTQARRRQPSFSVYRGLEKIAGPEIAPLDEIAAKWSDSLFASTFELHGDEGLRLNWQKVSPDPAVMLTYFALAKAQLPVAGDGLVDPMPIYLRPPDAREPIDLRGKALRAALRG